MDLQDRSESLSPELKVGSRKIQVSRLDKELFPGITKSDVIDYYRSVAPRMIAHTRDRLMTLERFPDGIDSNRFFSKDIPRYFPSWIARKTVRKEGGSVTHVVCNDEATLVYLANQAALVLHVGLSRIPAVAKPDQLIFDLDPATDDFPLVRSVARSVRAILDEIGLPSYVKTSGSKGLHIMVPLDAKAGFVTGRAFAHDVAALVAARDPDRVTIEPRKIKRKGRLFLDWMRNNYAQTAVAPYSLRPAPGAPVAMPVAWDELDERGMNPRLFTLDLAVRRVRSEPDPWQGWRRRARSLEKPARKLAVLRREVGDLTADGTG